MYSVSLGLGGRSVARLCVRELFVGPFEPSTPLVTRQLQFGSPDSGASRERSGGFILGREEGELDPYSVFLKSWQCCLTARLVVHTFE